MRWLRALLPGTLAGGLALFLFHSVAWMIPGHNAPVLSPADDRALVEALQKTLPRVPGTYFVSVHHYAESIFKAILDNPVLVRPEEHDTSLTSSLITLGVTSVVALALTTWRLRRMNLE